MPEERGFSGLRRNSRQSLQMLHPEGSQGEGGPRLLRYWPARTHRPAFA